MCLGTPLDKKAMNKYIRANRKDGSIVVWKVVSPNISRKHYEPPIENGVYSDVCSQPINVTDPQCAVHAFRDRKSAQIYARYRELAVRCRIKAKWLLEIGIGKGWGDNHYMNMHTLTASHMVMPKYPQKSVSLKRFKAVCKEHRI